MTIKHQAVNGIKWQVAVSMFQKFVTFGATIILARHLGPSVYGLFAFSLVVVSSFELFKSMGIDAALIRRKDDFGPAADTAFFIIPVLGVVLYIALNLCAPAIGNMLNNKEMTGIVRVLGLIFVIGCFTKVPVISLERQLKFKGISVAEIASTIMFSASALTFVSMNLGIWTLVYAYILKNFTYMALVWIFSGWKPSFVFNAKLALEMFHFGKFVFLTSALSFLKMNLDNLLVGKLLGATMLGYYAVAFNIANFGSDYFGGRVYRVIFPVYSKMQNNFEGLKSAFLNVIKYISLVAMPLATGTFLLGGDFIMLTYGDKWLSAVPALKILACIGIFNLIPVATDSVLMAMGKSSLSFKSMLVQVILFFIFIAPAAKFLGLAGVAVVVSAASLIAMVMQFIWVKEHFKLEFKEIFSSIQPAISASLVMCAAIIMFKYGLKYFALNDFIRYVFIPESALAVTAYFFTLFLKDRIILKEMKELI